MVQCYTCMPDLNLTGSTWMMTFQVGNNRVTEEDTNNIYEGNTMQNTWCMRWKYDAKDLSVAPVDLKTQSILFKTEAI